MNSFKTAVLLGALTGALLIFGRLLGGQSGMMLALILAAGMNFFAYWFSDKMVLAMHRATPITRDQAPDLYAVMEGLTARAGTPMPRLYVVQADAPNAFATGRNPSHAAVVVTTGILRLLDRNELEGVLAHELAHVKNRDILISSIAATMAGAITMLASMAKWGAIFGGYGGYRGDNDRDGGGNILTVLATAILAPIAAGLIQMAVSRSREYQADATGAATVGNPYGLASALQKLEDYGKRTPPLSTNMAMQHLYISNPFGGGMMSLFSTHPPIKERIRRLTGR